MTRPTLSLTSKPTPTQTWTTLPTTLPTPKIPSYPLHGTIEFLDCPDVVHKGIFIEIRDILNLKNSCKLQAESIIIEESMISVEGKTLYLIAKDVKILRTTFKGNNQNIRIVAKDIYISSVRFVGNNSTFEALGVTVFKYNNYHEGDDLRYKVMGSYVNEQLEIYGGTQQYHNLTVADIQQIRDEYSEDLSIYDRVGFETGNSSSVSDQSRYISRQRCIFRGNYQNHFINAPFYCKNYNHNDVDNIIIWGSAAEYKINANLSIPTEKIFKFRGIEYDVI